MMKNDTIVAVSSALGNGAIALVRLSGDDAINITSKVFSNKKILTAPSHTVHYGRIIDDEVIDEVLVTIFKAPKTYTKEDVVEIGCHGGVYVTERIVEALVKGGARLADPGEFTKRAFLNGRIDLTQSEAVMDMIEAQTQEALRIANRGLKGDIKNLIVNLRSYLVNVLAKIEVNIDYPEYEDEEQITNEVIRPIIEKVKKRIVHIIDESQKVLQIKNGLKTALIGKPNVGKSSLLNALIREEKAIVTSVAGTTRDIVEGKINLNGLVLNLLDTAGVHQAKDEVEAIGIKKTMAVIEDADLVLLVFDNSQALSTEDMDILSLTKNKRRLIIVNKSDLEAKIDVSQFEDYILLSAYNKEDILALENKLKDMLAYTTVTSEAYLANFRQLANLKSAKKSLDDAEASLNEGYPIDIISIDLNNAWLQLGEIIGAVNKDDLIDELFSKFCLGK